MTYSIYCVQLEIHQAAVCSNVFNTLNFLKWGYQQCLYLHPRDVEIEYTTTFLQHWSIFFLAFCNKQIKSTDAFMVLPVDVLGTEYLIPAWQSVDHKGGSMIGKALFIYLWLNIQSIVMLLSSLFIIMIFWKRKLTVGVVCAFCMRAKLVMGMQSLDSLQNRVNRASPFVSLANRWTTELENME